MKPIYIAVEGGEGSGKTSLCAALKAAQGDSVLVTKEPGGSSDGAVIRRLALTHPLAKYASSETLLYLMFADRFDHVEQIVLPALQKGIPVVTDRSDMSSYAYQVAAGDDPKRAEPDFWRFRRHLRRLPDLYVFVDVEPETGLGRRKQAGGVNHLDQRPLEFHRKVREGMRRFCDRIGSRTAAIDANRPFDQVKADFLALMRTELGIPMA